MRHKRLKKFRKTVQFFRSCYGFHPPFRVLVDGTFLSTLLKNKIRIQDLLESALGGPTQMVVTRSVLRELEQIPGLQPAFKMAQRLKMLTPVSHPSSFDGFGDDAPTAVPDSVRAMVTGEGGRYNPQHLFVATQDQELREELRGVPGVPLLYFQRVVLILEPPSTASLECAHRTASRNAVLGGPAVTEETQMYESEEDEIEQVGLKRKRFHKEPNPLSRLPKKKKPQVFRPPSSDKKKKRKKKKKTGAAVSKQDHTQEDGGTPKSRASECGGTAEVGCQDGSSSGGEKKRSHRGKRGGQKRKERALLREQNAQQGEGHST